MPQFTSARSWGNEVSWELEGIATGGAPTECAFSVSGDFCANVDVSICGGATDDVAVNVDDDCDNDMYELLLVDSYGDGKRIARRPFFAKWHNTGATPHCIHVALLEANSNSTEALCAPFPSCWLSRTLTRSQTHCCSIA